jgi:hypothetical protein
LTPRRRCSSGAIATPSRCGGAVISGRAYEPGRCRGDADACLAKAVALDRVPHRVAWQTRQNILTATPRNIGAPERAARQYMPIDFYLKQGRK